MTAGKGVRLGREGKGRVLTLIHHSSPRGVKGREGRGEGRGRGPGRELTSNGPTESRFESQVALAR